MNRLDSFERFSPRGHSPSWLEVACAWALVVIVVSALMPQPVKQVGLYPVTTIHSVFHSGLSEPIGLAGTDQRAGVSFR